MVQTQKRYKVCWSDATIKLDEAGAFAAEHRLLLEATAALAAGVWSKDTMKDLECKMQLLVTDSLVNGQGTRADTRVAGQ